MSQLSADCLSEIFEYLEEDKVTLYSCLLVNHLWCRVSVRILWRSIRNYNTLIACLPNESKEILHKNGIVISTSTSKTPMFNYASFCKFLLFSYINRDIEQFLQNLNKSNIYIVKQEIFKLLMNQIFSLRKLDLDLFSCYLSSRQNIPFTSYPGAKDCLKYLSELCCRSDINPKFFYQLSRICHNIQSLIISFEKVISNELTNLISAQQNLKYLGISQSYDCEGLDDIITSFPNTLTKLNFYGQYHYMPLSFIENLINLQELIISSYKSQSAFEDFEILQYVLFSQLRVLKFTYGCPRHELLIKFLENNGKNLKEIYIGNINNSLTLNFIAKFCPNLRKLFSGFKNSEINELETLRMIFNNCQYLESIEIL